MQMVNIHNAKTHLSQLVEQASAGEPFIIAKAGKPLVKVMPIKAPSADDMLRIGFMTKQIKIPDDFDNMGSDTIEKLFGGDK